MIHELCCLDIRGQQSCNQRLDVRGGQPRSSAPTVSLRDTRSNKGTFYFTQRGDMCTLGGDEGPMSCFPLLRVIECLQSTDREEFMCTLLVALVCCSVSLSQSDRGTITGTISDPGHAVVSGGAVFATNTETGAK